MARWLWYFLGWWKVGEQCQTSTTLPLSPPSLGSHFNGPPLHIPALPALILNPAPIPYIPPLLIVLNQYECCPAFVS